MSAIKATDGQLLTTARLYQNVSSWREGDWDSCSAAYKRGKDFYKQCCAHMTRLKPRNRVMPKRARWRTMPEAEIIESAKKFKTRKEWKLGDFYCWMAARRRGDELYIKCCSHMVTGANPFNAPYVIYVFEFNDNHAYVGLTFQPNDRLRGHLSGGPVHEHLKLEPAPAYVWKIIETGIIGGVLAGVAEKRWIAEYAKRWVMLNKSPGGETGGIGSKITNEDLAEDARNFKTRCDWKLAHGNWWCLAKKRGIYEQCVAHMPKRQPVSAEVRAKLSASGKRRKGTFSQEQRDKHSAFMKKLIAERGSPASRPEVAAKISASRKGMKFTAEHRQNISDGKRRAFTEQCS